MSGLPDRKGRRYAHSARRRREPMFAIAAGVVVIALCIPVAWHALSSDTGHHTASPRTRSSSTAPRSTSAPEAAPTSSIPSSAPPSSAAPTTTGPITPATDPIPLAAPGVVIQVVPAVRDVEVMVGGTLYTSTSDGIVNAPAARGTVAITYLGYSVTPALQEVSFRTWSDGLTTPNRNLDADGHGHVSLAIDLRYRVTVNITGATGPDSQPLTATSPVGALRFTNGARRWVLAERGERSGNTVVARTITYSFAAPAGASGGRRQDFTAHPEDLWEVRAS